MYKLTAIDSHGSESIVATLNRMQPVAVDDGRSPRAFLELASPNPVRGNASVALRYGLAQSRNVNLALLHVPGRRVRLLASGAQAPGAYLANWDGRDEQGSLVAAGLDFVRFDGSGIHPPTPWRRCNGSNLDEHLPPAKPLSRTSCEV